MEEGEEVASQFLLWAEVLSPLLLGNVFLVFLKLGQRALNS